MSKPSTTLHIQGIVLHQVHTMEQMRHQGGRAGRGRRMGLRFYRYTVLDGTVLILEDRIDQHTDAEQLSKAIEVGCIYLLPADMELTSAAIVEENLTKQNTL
jgi:hypothetical protein